MLRRWPIEPCEGIFMLSCASTLPPVTVSRIFFHSEWHTHHSPVYVSQQTIPCQVIFLCLSSFMSKKLVARTPIVMNRNSYCHTRPILEFQLDWKSGKSQLARWATEWQYNHSAGQPASQPPNRLLWFLCKSKIFQQPLIGSSSNFKLKLKGPNQIQKCLKWQPPMEDDLKILKVEYLRNHWLDLPQISNLSSGDQTKNKNNSKDDTL
jgi:hypothetical protein